MISGDVQGLNPDFIPLVVDSGKGSGTAEYEFSIPEDGLYVLFSVYASVESRPTNIFIDNKIIKSDGLKKITGGSVVSDTVVFKELEIYLAKGSHRLKIFRDGFIPHIHGFIFTKENDDIHESIVQLHAGDLEIGKHSSLKIIIFPPELKRDHFTDDLRMKYDTLRAGIYPYKKENNKHFNFSDGIVSQSKTESIYLYGDTSEVHRWGVNLDEIDFYKQSEKLKYCVVNKIGCRAIIGVRRTNFYRLGRILRYVNETREIDTDKKQNDFNLKPLKNVRKRFNKYLTGLSKKVSIDAVVFHIVDKKLDDLLMCIEHTVRRRGYKEKELLRALGPVCKDVFIGPRLVLLNLCGLCNTDCVYCRKYSPFLDKEYRKGGMKGKQVLDLDVIKKVLSNARKMKVENILLVGEGEPTIYPQFMELIKAIKKCGFKFNISTNGMLLDKYAKLLASGSCESVTVSMSFASPGTFNKYILIQICLTLLLLKKT